MTARQDPHLEVAVRPALSSKDIQVMALSGNLDIRNIEQLETALEALFEKGHYRLVFNLKGLTYISSAGFGVLLSVLKRVRHNQGDIKITGAGPDVRKVFELLELPTVLRMFDSEEKAVQDF